MIEKTHLLKAILDRSIVQIQECMLEGGDIFYKDDHGRSYLQLSVFLKSKELVEFFLTEGLCPNEADNDYVTPLHRACRLGSNGIVELLLDHGADANAEAVRSITPLHIAAAFGYVKCVQVLCQKSRQISINCIDKDLHTPLHFAASEGHKQIVEILIKRNCDVNIENVAGNRPLHFAATLDAPDICSILLEHGAEIDARNFNGQTALHMAIQQACPKIVLFLLKNGADPNIQDTSGYTCSHLAIKSGRVEILDILMNDSRTDSSICDNEGDTVLHVALKLGHYNLIPMMLPKARDLTKQDANGNSVIIEAIKNQLEEVALEMLKNCPSLAHTKTFELVTPLHLAAERGMTHLTKQLLISGAQVDATDAGGLTPSLYCAKNDMVLECLAMIEDIMMISDADDNEQQPIKNNRNNSKISSRISS